MKIESSSDSEPLAAPGPLYDETIFASPELVDGQRVILHAERLVPTVTPVRGKLATITRRAVTVRRQIEVDVTHEELVVSYEPGDGTEMLRAEPDKFSVLLRAEDVVVTKTVRVVEEVFISTRPVADIERVNGAVRHEVLELPTSS